MAAATKGFLAAALLGVALGLAVWSLRPHSGGDLIRHALEAQTTLSQAQTVIPVTGVIEARRYDQALSLAAGAPVTVPDLDGIGFRLTALRFGEGGSELFYLGRDGETLTLCLHPSDGQVRLDRFERGPLRLVLWQNEKMAMTAAAELPFARLQKLAAHAYSQMQL